MKVVQGNTIRFEEEMRELLQKEPQLPKRKCWLVDQLS